MINRVLPRWSNRRNPCTGWRVASLCTRSRAPAKPLTRPRMKYLFEVHIKPGHCAEEYANAWVRASEIIQRAPGAQGTLLHRKIDDPNTLLAIASWQSKAERDAMERHHDPVVKQIIESAATGCEIRLIGEFEEPEWVVMPNQSRET